MDIEIKPVDRISGEIDVPGDKSISHRAAMIGSIAKGNTRASNFLTGDDCLRTIDAFKKMRVKIELNDKTLNVEGKGLRGLKKPEEDLYLGNSGTTMRLISGILAGQNFETILTGDESLSKRPMARIIEPLKLMGANISSVKNNGSAPLKIKGGNLKSVKYKTNVASAQVKSCVLLAGLYAGGETTVEEPFKSRDHTERMLSHFGANIKIQGNKTSVEGAGFLSGKIIRIPGDISSAAFFIVMAVILEGSALSIRSCGINPTRRRIIDVLKRMGADITIENEKKEFEPVCDLIIKSSSLTATKIKEEEIPLMIDEVPILCVAAAQAKGTTEIVGVGELRVKETDRVFSIIENLRKLNVDCDSKDNNLFITGRKKRFSPVKEAGKPVLLNSFKDHRTAMSTCVAIAASDSSARISDAEFIGTSFPGFFDYFNYLKK